MMHEWCMNDDDDDDDDVDDVDDDESDTRKVNVFFR